MANDIVVHVSPAASDNGGTDRAARRLRAHGRGSRVIARVCAWLLVVLVAAPFTSPFSTCDVRALVNVADDAVVHTPPQVTSALAWVAAYDTESAPLSIEEDLAKDDVLVTDVLTLHMPPAAAPAATPVSAARSAFRAPLVALRL